MGLDINPPAPRSEVLNCRVTEENKKFVQALAQKHKTAESIVVDAIIKRARQAANAGNKRKPARTT